jgi:uncharacterized RDD family membrane protein YckC/cytoskeletal protein CcmA (bactofilin family)
MNQNRSPLPPLWLALALAFLPALRAQETPPAPAPAPETPVVAPAVPPTEQPAVPPAETPAPAPAVEPVTVETPAPVPAVAPAAVETPAAAAVPAVPAAAPAEEPMRELAPATEAADEKPAEEPQAKKKRVRSGGHDTPPVFGTQTIPAGKTQRGAVSISGDTIVDGELSGEAVSVLGSTTVNGSVGDAAVSVLGTTTVNGRVKGAAVAILGDVVLGPEAVVEGEVVAVLGAVRRAPGAQVGGGVQQVGGSFLTFGDFAWIRAYFMECLRWGRPLAFGEHLGWAWGVAGIFLVFYALLALIFPRGVERCAEALEQKPGGTILAALLAVLVTPILFVLLAITGIGIVLIPFLAAAGFFATLFGKAAVLAWFGRRVTGLFGPGVLGHAVFAVLIGGVIVTLLYCIPFLGFLLWKLFGVLGLGMVVYVLAGALRRERPAAPAFTAPPPAGAAANPFVAPASAAAAAVPVASVPSSEPPPAGPAFTPTFGAPPPPAAAPAFAAAMPGLAAATLPRAGFWIRTAAASLDFLMIAVALGMMGLLENGPGLLFLGVATYCAVMWKLKGTTIGGVICGLKVVRLDDRPVDWGVAIVRALSAFLSLFAAGLGFIWVAFDDERQSWHDKIAGTTIVRVPKGTSLL